MVCYGCVELERVGILSHLPIPVWKWYGVCSGSRYFVLYLHFVNGKLFLWLPCGSSQLHILLVTMIYRRPNASNDCPDLAPTIRIPAAT